MAAANFVSAVLRNYEGVILRYADAANACHASDLAPKGGDLQRIELLQAERAVISLYAITECLDVAEFARDRIIDRLELVRRALQVKRQGYGMPSFAECEI